MIVIVEDCAVTRQRLQKTIQKNSSYPTFCFSTAESALEAVTINSGLIRLLITDVYLPGDDGIKLALTIRGQEECQDIPILIISSGPKPGIVSTESRSNDSPIRFISKPIQNHELLREIDDLVNNWRKEISTND